jgi:hypothetical protein
MRLDCALTVFRSNPWRRCAYDKSQESVLNMSGEICSINGAPVGRVLDEGMLQERAMLAQTETKSKASFGNRNGRTDKSAVGLLFGVATTLISTRFAVDQQENQESYLSVDYDTFSCSSEICKDELFIEDMNIISRLERFAVVGICTRRRSLSWLCIWCFLYSGGLRIMFGWSSVSQLR